MWCASACACALGEALKDQDDGRSQGGLARRFNGSASGPRPSEATRVEKEKATTANLEARTIPAAFRVATRNTPAPVMTGGLACCYVVVYSYYRCLVLLPSRCDLSGVSLQLGSCYLISIRERRGKSWLHVGSFPCWNYWENKTGEG